MCVLFPLSGGSRAPAIGIDCILTNIFNTQLVDKKLPNAELMQTLHSLLVRDKLLLIDSKWRLQRGDQSGLLNQNAFLLSHVLIKLRDYTV